MNEIVKLLNEMCCNGVVKTYAIFGAVAQMKYTEAVVTMDIDVLVAVPEADCLAILHPIYEFCAQKGYFPEGDSVRVGAWPVQFIPAFDRLSMDAMNEADETDMNGITVRVVKAVYLAAMALKTGRGKDKARILALIEAGAVRADEMESIAKKYEMENEWNRFGKQFSNET